MTEEKFFWSRHDENEEFEKHLQDIIRSGSLVLDVGCGDQKMNESMMGVDAYSTHPFVNVQAYMWDMPFGDNSVDGLVCMMALEHVSKYQVMPVLAEFYRVLRPGAKFAILVPNLVWVLQRFIENPNHDWEMDMVFGTHENEGEVHKTGFTEEIILKYFNTAIPDCKIIKIYTVNAYNQMSFGIIAEK